MLKLEKLLGLIVTCAAALPAAAPAGELFEHIDPASGTRIVVLKQGGTTVRFAPSRGANVFSIEVAGVEYLRRPADMYTFSGAEHGIPILYPTPNRVRDATFRYDGVDYRMQANLGPHRIHGLVIGEAWRVVSTRASESSVEVRSAITFAPGSERYRQFPFEHTLFATVTVTDGTVRWTYEVDNRSGRTPVPFGFGLHPYFLYQGSRERTFVTLPATHLMEAEDFLPTGRLVPSIELDYPLGTPMPIGKRTFDDVFWGMSSSDPAVIDFRDSERRVSFLASPEFNHAVLWTPRLPVLSLENQTSSTDAHNLHAAGFEEAAQLQLCEAGETCSGWVEYRFSASGSFDWIWEDPGFVLSQERCASCHGIAFTGARAPALLNGTWRHPHAPADLGRIIRQGIPGTDMPAFEGALSDRQIEDLIEFMDLVLIRMPVEESRSEQAASQAAVRQSFLATFEQETLVDRLDTPWSFAFLPDGRIILSEKPGRLRLLDGGILGEPVTGTPVVAYRQDAGLLALALHPDFAENGWIYLAYANPGADPDTSTTRVVRGRIRDGAWVDQETIWSAPPELYTSDNSHFGTRLLFVGGELFFSIGDRGIREQAQDLGSPYGKIHRVHADGTIPADNPFVGTAGALPSLWSYGHRNVQGLALSADRALWASEHGPRGGDELNRIEPGRNYGWPLATWGREFSGEEISPHRSMPGVKDPALVWQEAIAPSNIVFYEGAGFPAWRGNLLVASLAAKELRRLEIRNGEVVSQEVLVSGIGRIRDVQVGPDGNPYLAVERGRSAGSLVRLVPARPQSDISLFDLSQERP